MNTRKSVALKVKRTHPGAIIPKFATHGAACFDLHAVIDGEPITIMPGQNHKFQIGLQFEVPEGFVMLIYSRSGSGFKTDVRLANCTGVIDSDYRGDIGVKLTRDACCGEVQEFIVKHGERIAQAMLVEVPALEMIEVDALTETVRGAGGFGSTGAA